jgi:hypothetical protein
MFRLLRRIHPQAPWYSPTTLINSFVALYLLCFYEPINLS